MSVCRGAIEAENYCLISQGISPMMANAMMHGPIMHGPMMNGPMMNGVMMGPMGHVGPMGMMAAGGPASMIGWPSRSVHFTSTLGHVFVI